MRLSRREMLLATAGAGAAAVLPGCAAQQTSDEAETESLLDEKERRALAAAVERILPGAVEAGVPEYIDYWLAREPFRDVLLNGFQIGAEHLDKMAMERGGSFADLDGLKQDEILSVFQRGELKVRKFTGRAFFEFLFRFALEGFLSDPKYGGNREQVGWRFIGHEACWWAPARAHHGSHRG